MEFLQNTLLPSFNYWVYVILLMIGLYAMISKNNLIKKLIGMSIFQTAIILFFVSLGAKNDADIPILHHHAEGHEASVAHAEPETDAHGEPGHDTHDAHGASDSHVNPDDYANPLPHVLMLTAIVVGVATLGVALAVSQRVFRDYDTLEENEILAKIATTDG